MDDVGNALAVLRETIPSPSFDAQFRAAATVPTSEMPTVRYQPEYWQTLQDILGIEGVGRKPLSVDAALQISAVLICLDVLSQDIGKVTLRMKRRVRGGAEIVLPREHWFAAMLADQPNEQHTWPEYIEMTLLHLGLAMNAYTAKKDLRRDGSFGELIPLMPGRVLQEVNATRTAYVYWVNTVTNAEAVLHGNLPGVLLEDETIHFRGRMFDGVRGYSTLSAGATVMGLAQEVANYQRSLYRNEGQMRGVFEKKDDAATEGLSNDAFNRLRNQLAERYGAFRSQAKPLVLEEGLTFKSVQMTADEAELLTAHEAAVEDCCRLFRMPPHKAMHMKAVKYENLETIEKAYVNDTLIPWANKLEKRYARCILSPQERLDYFFEFDREEMALYDAAKRTAQLKDELMFGTITIDEYRAARGRNPLPNGAGEVRMIGSTYTLIDDKNEVVLAAGKPGDQTGSPDDGETNPKPAGDDAGKSLENVVPLRA